ncbi:uncharacterized protein HMPREF1541_01896 [Cyphellophora europaea CBS 101466]|uniref:TauD/TfdA-like domain-containing protein n=1 Tax=Cyphellophora europaea (strain CBS 101466) TaxID=1220924 RepID=W2S3V9_CYPE1|nr:uncharacterized protein HMPREF1541_01896 [Cyphellophora europaea CBS 101466]ETN42738.1 hypothetical protein HMPREF1541_01896 [Cyphellophora europaea CBS 101466]
MRVFRQLSHELRRASGHRDPLLTYGRRRIETLAKQSPIAIVQQQPFEEQRHNRTRLMNGTLFDQDTGKCTVSPVYLRQACTCNKCVDPSDGQRNFSLAYIPKDIEIRNHHQDEHGNHVVQWSKDAPGFDSDHVSVYSVGKVKAEVISHKMANRGMYDRYQQLWNGKRFPLEQTTIPYDDYMSSPESLALALHYLWRYGLIFIRDVPPDEDSVSKLAERIALLRNTFYGKTWDVRSKPNAENVAYTSRYLGFHMDLLYMKEPPGLQLLHCIENTCEGGESAFADTFQALYHLARHKPMLYTQLLGKQITYGYQNGPYSYFDTKNLVSRTLPTAPEKKKRFTQKVDHQTYQLMRTVDRVYWSPPFISSNLDLAFSGSRRQIELGQGAMKAFSDALENDGLRVETKLPAGTCAIFDNLRIVHARKAFNTNSGHRWLRGAYLDYQDFVSKAEELRSLMPEDAPSI